MAEYIDKKHLIDFLDGCIEEERGTRHQVIVEAIKLTVERMPTVDEMERKHGKWQKWNGDAYVVTEDDIAVILPMHKCSVCGKESMKWFNNNFCSVCGAEMENEDE